MRLSFQVSLTLLWVGLSFLQAPADEPVTLIGTIVKWRYPDAEIGKSEMSDAATVKLDGERTVPSTDLRTTMTTDDSVDKVIAFYKTLLTRSAANDAQLGFGPDEGISIRFSDESAGRNFELHTVLVNAANISTVVIVTRGNGESQTHITWKQFRRHP